MVTGPVGWRLLGHAVGWWLLGQKWVGGYWARSRLAVTGLEVGWRLLG